MREIEGRRNERRGRGREDHRGLETAGVRQAERNMEDKKDSVMRVFDVIKCYSSFFI